MTYKLGELVKFIHRFLIHFGCLHYSVLGLVFPFRCSLCGVIISAHPHLHLHVVQRTEYIQLMSNTHVRRYWAGSLNALSGLASTQINITSLGPSQWRQGVFMAG